MILNVETRVATANIAFSTSRIVVALTERKMLQYSKISTKLHYCTLSELKLHVFTLSNVHACLSIHCLDQERHSNSDFSTKSVSNTLRTCGNRAFVYLQA